MRTVQQKTSDPLQPSGMTRGVEAADNIGSSNVKSFLKNFSGADRRLCIFDLMLSEKRELYLGIYCFIRRKSDLTVPSFYLHSRCVDWFNFFSFALSDQHTHCLVGLLPEYCNTSGP